jgi:peptidoglycan/xylan/chitin deacetylase (PgdA/CDA1 family)
MEVKRRNALAAAAAAIALAATACEADAGGSARAPSGEPSRGSTRTPSRPASRTLGPLPAEVRTGPRSAYVALTFHGQGDPKLVQQLLAEIEGGGARVTVLAVGTWLSEQPAIARRILDGGHELGNHTQNHLAIAEVPAFAEIDACAQTLKRLTGSIGTWFRPSQTQRATAVIEAQAARVGYPTCLSYDVDSLDYTDPGPEAVVYNVLRAVGGSIVSLHCGHIDTVMAIPAVLDGLRQKGLSPVTMTELMTR